MEMDTWTIQGNGFHFGRRGLGQETTAAVYPSDSLYSALAAQLAQLEDPASLEAFLEPFQRGAAPFLLTSAFPFAGGVRFFPTPLLPPGAHPNGSEYRPKQLQLPGQLKLLKQVAYLSEGLFRRVLAGERLEAVLREAHFLQGKRAAASTEEIKRLPRGLKTVDGRLWKVDKRPRVVLGRSAQNSSIYFTGRVSYAPDCGLWFGVRWFSDDPTIKALVARLLQVLGDSGLGGERSAGFGVCQITPGEVLDLPDPAGKPWVLLSRCLPLPDESGMLAAEGASYKLESVGGWIDSPSGRGQRRRQVNMLAEGSVLGPLAKEAPGAVVDVRPVYPGQADTVGHPVYRLGLGLGVGMEVSEL